MPVPPALLWRPRPVQQRIFDSVLAAAVALVCLLAAAESPAAGPREPAWLTLIAALALGAPLAARRHRPLSVAAVVLFAAASCLATGLIPAYTFPAPALAAGVALYSVGAAAPTRPGLVTLAAGAGLVAAATLVADDAPDGPGRIEVAFVVLVFGACWLLGWTLRERRAHAARAAAQATTQAVTEERLRIAREIHDIVGHSLTVIAVKSAIGSHVAAQRPAEAGAALDVIAATSRSALTELRRAVSALRTEPDFAPAPTLADLRQLADRAAEAGVAVRLEVRGDCDVPDGVALAAVRIVQESLTNVVKHVGTTSCRIDVVGSPGELRVEVTNDGAPGLRPATDGAGLTGMRERVALHAGALTAGPRDHGGFRVQATLPYERPT
ncbi:histidine kinase [Actinoplanes sp. ATCC 53533]|uniref:sensor histidine kinase n=1 Tax=Actinoplanes sp. ATCC 53533 TaxID=1288362 RepID=UPI000F7A1D36|nr:sensor histidine kinase [Actinoplanes sp. ATCC 53533]RSM63767.1 histidine kinase [Actinoplanes sp. ATCC 53533]